VPKTKLTLSVDSDAVERAKRFSRKNQTSVSELVSAFLSSLEDHEELSTPVASRLRGVLPSDVGVGEYREHLESKYE